MLNDGTLTAMELEEEIRLGFFRPSLLWDIASRPSVPRFLWPLCDAVNTWRDTLKNYTPHREVYLAKQRRLQTEKDRAGQSA